VRVESLFLYKAGESLAFSSWAFLFFGTPLLAAYGVLFEVPWHFYPVSLVFCSVFLIVPSTIGTMIAMLVTSFLPRSKRGFLIGLGLLLLSGVAYFIWHLISLRATSEGDLQLVSEILDSIGFTRNPLFPSYWVAKGVLAWSGGEYGNSLFFLGLTGLTGIFFSVVASLFSSRLMHRGWFLSQGRSARKRLSDRTILDLFSGPILFFVPRSVRLIVVKDLKALVRDPVQWSQFLIFFGLLALYFFNLRTFQYDDRNLFWKNLIAQLNLLATSLTLATFSTRFIFPQLSLEGRRFWVIGTAPMKRDHILFGKLALCFVITVGVSEVLILISSVMLGTPFPMAVLHSVALLGICFGLSGLSVGLGSLYPDFTEDNPSKIVSGFGGTLNLVLSLSFVIVVLVIQAIPCFLFFGKEVLTATEFRMWVLLALGAIAGVSLVTGLVPVQLGLKKIRSMEF
ncbi:MAG: hypothetical protein QF645_09830, partial [Planctomycetota bacterium]|nr:hypothetical protein [Planctomycetota bacterium]